MDAGQRRKDGIVNTDDSSWGGHGNFMEQEGWLSYFCVRSAIPRNLLIRKTALPFPFTIEEYRKTLSYLGTVSGRDEQKIEKSRSAYRIHKRCTLFHRSKHGACMPQAVCAGNAGGLLPGCRLD